MGGTILYYDCFAGISGDMHLGAMVDCGVPEDHLRRELARLGLHGWSLRFTRDSRMGISGTRADVDVEGAPHAHGHEHGHDHDHSLDGADHGHEHAHRSWADIRALISGSGLSEPVTARALGIFRKLAEAEASVHGTAVDDVRFHEVGAVDSIVDIVGAAVCLEYLKPDRVLCSTVELGSGFVRCQHGLLPVPAPATALLLTGVPVRSGAVPFEMTTPTGAAILAASVHAFTDDKRFTIRRTAYGVGHRDTEIPNVLRVFLAEAAQAGAATASAHGAVPAGEACLLECNIDDMSPEMYGHVSDRLFSAGAADVYFTPIIMKKSRPAVMLSVLCPAAAEEMLTDIILRETTTFGLRRLGVGKVAMEREMYTVKTSLGDVRVKAALRDGRRVKSKPEYEDCRRIALERNMPLREVYETVLRETGGANG
jgi:pyridinium-3,5-bisthiocarboxylic acid mononucleotide nickel chelatase